MSSTEPLLADDTQETTDATTTQDEAAQTDQQPTPEQQPAEEAATTDQDSAPAEQTTEEPEGAPESYAFEVPAGLPEGYELDEQILESVSNVARELDLSQDKAQKLVDTVWPVMHQRAQDKLDALHKQWEDESMADPEIGGSKWPETKKLAVRGIKAYGDPDLEELLFKGPLGSNRAMIRAWALVGRDVSEDKVVTGDTRGESVDLSDPAVQAARLYGAS